MEALDPSEVEELVEEGILKERDENRDFEEKLDISDREQDSRIQNGGWAVMILRLKDQKSDSLIRKLSCILITARRVVKGSRK